MSESVYTRSLLKFGARWLVRLALLAFALLVAAAITVVVVLPRATDGSAMTVLTGSMTPKIPVGSIVLVRPVDPGTLEVGDIATYQAKPDEDTYITHRITKIHQTDNGLTFTFKGDANRGPDLDVVPAVAIRGQVWFHVPYLGTIRDGLHGKGGISLVVMILLAGYAVTQLSGGLRDRKRKNGQPGSGGDQEDVTPSLIVGRPLIVATLARPDTDEPPVELVRRWTGLLLRSDESTYTFLVAPPEGGVEAALELLFVQHPLHVEVWDAPTIVAGASTEVRLSASTQVSGAATD
jgi:signal peptidase